jgi:hypothetical protein
VAEAAYVLFVKQRPAVVSAISDTSNTPLEWTGRHQTLLRRPRLPACHSGAAFEGDLMPVDPVI